MNVGQYFQCDDNLMPPEPVCIEIGVFTLTCANAVFDRWPKARYICVEPSSANFATLVKAIYTVPINRSSRTETLRAALSDRDGEIPFYDLGHEQLHSAFPRHMTEGLKLHGIERVQGLTLRSMLDASKVQTCDLLLLNCEGAEILALEELIRCRELRARVTQISTSNHCRHVYIYQQGLWNAVVRALEEWYDVQSREPVPNIEYFLLTRKGN